MSLILNNVFNATRWLQVRIGLSSSIASLSFAAFGTQEVSRFTPDDLKSPAPQVQSVSIGKPQINLAQFSFPLSTHKRERENEKILMSAVVSDAIVVAESNEKRKIGDYAQQISNLSSNIFNTYFSKPKVESIG